MKLHAVSATINLCLILIVFFKKSFCLDPYYKACVPKSCGDGINMSYPFFIQGLQDPSCGYPGFEIHCSNRSSVIQISGNSFILTSYDLGNRSMTLVNAQDIACDLKLTNLTLDPNRFSMIYGNSTTELVVLTNCSGTGTLPGNLERYRIGSTCNSVMNRLVMLRNDRNLGMGMERCRDNATVMPVDGEWRNRAVDGGNYEEVMMRGFKLRWFAADCGVCQRSGGRCGFNRTEFQFRCFCRHRPHRVSCLTGTDERVV